MSRVAPVSLGAPWGDGGEVVSPTAGGLRQQHRSLELGLLTFPVPAHSLVALLFTPRPLKLKAPSSALSNSALPSAWTCPFLDKTRTPQISQTAAPLKLAPLPQACLHPISHTGF